MNLNIYGILITYFMVFIGLWAMTLVEAIEPWFVALAGLAAIIGLVFTLKKLRLLSPVLWNVLAAILFGVFVLDYLFLSQSLIASASRFLTILLVLKLFDLNANRDYLIVYSLVFFQILASAASTISPVFFLLLAFFVFSAIWAMIVFNIKRDFQGHSAGAELPRIVFGAPFFVFIILVFAGSIVVTFALFFILPRIGVGMFERKTLNTIKVTGFSDSIDLGAIGTVKTDPTIVARVEVKGKALLPLYLRGTALEHYDGKTWTRRRIKARLVKRDFRGLLNLDRLNAMTDTKGLTEINILLEPLDTDVIFALPDARLIEAGFQNVWIDQASSIYLASPPFTRISYRVWSGAYEEEGSSPASSPKFADDALQYFLDASYAEKSPEAERIQTLARELTEGLETNREKAEAIEKHLKSGYRYTLDPKATEGVGPVEDFLFYSQEGYCEHYASAMVLLLRSVGIPARIVTGFVQGELNPVGNYYIVRQQDAHSWVEAYLDSRTGWAQFDPTPAAGIASIKRASEVSLYADMLLWRWNRYIVQYSFADQRRFAVKAEGGISRFAARLRGALRGADVLKPGRAAYAVAGIILAVLLYALSRNLRSKHADGFKTPRYYLKMTSVLGKKGLFRASHETPLEFAKRVNSDSVLDITKAHEIERYGGKRLNSSELRAVETAIERLKGLH